MSSHRRYIGDGVYVHLDELERVVLTTEDALRVTNRIVLGLNEYTQLLFWHSQIFLERLQEEYPEEEGSRDPPS